MSNTGSATHPQGHAPGNEHAGTWVRVAEASVAASQATATGLAANSTLADLQEVIDPQQDGKYTGPVNGQATSKPTGGSRSGGDPVERFDTPVALLEGPESAALTTSGSASLFAGTHQHFTAQRDGHLAAGAAASVISGDAAGLHTADGDIKLIANHGPVSIEAHADIEPPRLSLRFHTLERIGAWTHRRNDIHRSARTDDADGAVNGDGSKQQVCSRGRPGSVGFPP